MGLVETMAGTGVTVNAWIPGATHTAESVMGRAREWMQSGKTFAEVEQQTFDGPRSTSLLRRFLRPSEVANFVVFLASDQASAITGAVVHMIVSISPCSSVMKYMVLSKAEPSSLLPETRYR
jgi:NAD(P)-dependent dehydrogenase (short-subunit alcohol dehydrogenase family)